MYKDSIQFRFRVFAVSGYMSNGYSQCFEFCTGQNGVVKKCDEGYYYDVILSRCDSCNSICDYQRSMGTSEECKQHCPKVFDEFTTKNYIQCLEGSYFDEQNGKCIDCLTVCEKRELFETTDRCKYNCQKDSLFNNQHAASNDIGLIIGLSIGGGLIVVAFIYFIKYLFTKYSTTSNTPSRDEEQGMSLTATFVPIPDPIHDQCTDDGYTSLESSTGTETTVSGICEEEKFPVAFPELPSTARHNSM